MFESIDIIAFQENFNIHVNQIKNISIADF